LVIRKPLLVAQVCCRFAPGVRLAPDCSVTFTQGSSSATYTLTDVDENEAFTLNSVAIDGSSVSTAHTGTWTGTITMDGENGEDQEYTMNLVISAGGNAISGAMSIPELGESGSFSGTETGSVLDATWNLTSTGGCIMSGPLTGTFSGNTLNGNEPVTADSCGLEPGDEDADGHAFTLTKS